MIFERILRGFERFAQSYLEKLAETRAKIGEEKSSVLEEVRAKQAEAEQSKVSNAIKGWW